MINSQNIMLKINVIKNPNFVLSSAIILTVLIGIFDYFSGIYTSLILLYIVPIILISLYTDFGKKEVYTIVLIASTTWLFSNLDLLQHISLASFIWNIFVRFALFLIFGMINYRLKKNNIKLLSFNKELKHLNFELKNLNEEKNKFIGIAAHDLRNPIGAIYSFSDLILSNYAELNQKNIITYVGYIKNLSNNSLSLLKNLLDVSKIESGKIELNTDLHNYISFLKELIVFNNLIASKKFIIIKLETIEEELIFNFDKHYLSEVINNLLSNAIKFSFNSSEITIRVYFTKNNTVKTEVVDFGQGIASAEQNKLFKYFQKTSTQPTAGESGTGLGLAIAKQIVLSHGGTIGLTSELGSGSVFYFELPYLK